MNEVTPDLNVADDAPISPFLVAVRMERRASKAIASFCAGFFMTMVLVVAVPVVVEEHITPLIEDAVGDSTFLTLSSSFIVSALAWCVMFGIMAVLGSGGVMRWFGLSGIAGLIVAYYVLGDLTQAVVPLLSLAAVSLAFWIHEKNKEKRDGSRGKRVSDDRDIPDRWHERHPALKSVLYPFGLTLFADGLGCCSHYVFLLFRRQSGGVGGPFALYQARLPDCIPIRRSDRLRIPEVIGTVHSTKTNGTTAPDHQDELSALIAPVASAHMISAVYLFGSRAVGDARPDSDYDLLVDVEDGISYLGLFAFQDALEDVLGRGVDIVTSRSLGSGDPFSERILSQKVLLWSRRSRHPTGDEVSELSFSSTASLSISSNLVCMTLRSTDSKLLVYSAANIIEMHSSGTMNVR